MKKLKKPRFANFLKLWLSRPTDVADLFEKIMLQGKPVNKIALLSDKYLINDPNSAQKVLNHTEREYTKISKFTDRLSIVFGNGLVTSEGELWQTQRELLQPFFFPKYLERYAELATNKTIKLMQTQWQTLAQKNKKIDISNEMMLLVLSISAEALFSQDFGKDTQKILDVVGTGQKFILSYYLLPPSIPSLIRYKYRKLDAYFQNAIEQMVIKRRALNNKPDDILTCLSTATDPHTHEALPMHLIKSQIITMMVTGHETTGPLLGWIWYEIGSNKEVYQKLVAELDEQLQGQPPSLKDLQKLKYMRMVVDEALRLYPVIWALPRRNKQDEELAGYRIPKDSMVLVNPYSMQHDPRLWDEPLKFDPERFNKAKVCPRHKMAYFPFGGGNRICIGKNFALQQVMIILSIVLQQYDVTVLNKRQPRKLPLVSLKQRDSVKAKIKPRAVK